LLRERIIRDTNYRTSLEVPIPYCSASLIVTVIFRPLEAVKPINPNASPNRGAPE